MEVDVSFLVVDSENPRLSSTLESQEEIIRNLVKNNNDRDKLFYLIQDICKYGLNPSEIMVIMPSINFGYYIVLEGNRRLAAIKILEEPKPYLLLFTKVQQEEILKFNKVYKKKENKTINCHIVNTREEAEHWLELRHQGQQKGAGIIPWGATEAARFRQFQGKKEPHLQIIDYLLQKKAISDMDKSNIPITSFKRIIEDRYTRDNLGYEIRNGEFISGENESRMIELFGRIINDLTTGKIHVKDVYTKEDRIKYLNENVLSINQTPIISHEEESIDSQQIGNQEKTDYDEIKNNELPITPDQNRETLIPQNVNIRIEQKRINEIYHELKGISIKKFPNAVAVLLRVFIELSVDMFINTISELVINTEDRGITLATKINEVGNYLRQENILNDKQLKPIRRAVQSDSPLGASVTTMNQYIHNQYFKPISSDLITIWDYFEEFIIEIWKLIEEKEK